MYLPVKQSISGLVVKFIVAIDEPRVRFPADAVLIFKVRDSRGYFNSMTEVVLVVGSGGREHALSNALCKSDKISKVL